LVGQLLFGQRDAIRFYHYSNQDGLPQNSIYAITQDYLGYIWIGTEDGLARFNGYGFEIYKNNPADSNSISNNVIIALFEDSRKNLWVGTAYGGINIFDSTRQHITRLMHNPDNPNSLISNRIQDIKEDHQGFIWVGTDQGVDRINPITYEIEHFYPDPTSGRGLNHRLISKIAVLPNQHIWIGTILRGINVFDPKTKTFHYISDETTKPFTLPEKRTRFLYCDPLDSQVIWIGLRLKGVLKVNWQTNECEHIHATSGRTKIPSNYILGFQRDYQGRMWIGTADGLALWDRNDSLIAIFKNDPSDPYSLSANDISALFLDRTGNLWIGTLSGGLNKTDTKPPKFEWLRYSPEPGKGLNNPLVWTVLKTRDDRVIVGTDKGITVFHPERDRTTYFSKENSDLGSDYVQSLYQDRYGNIWIGTYRGLYRMNKNGEIQPVPIAIDTESQENSIICFQEAGKDSVWIGTENGLVLLNIRDFSYKRYFKSAMSPPEPTSVIYSIVTDSVEHVVWLGTYGGGVVKFNPETGARIYINSYAQKGRALSNDYVFCMLQDPVEEEFIWVGTRTGLNRLDKISGEIIFYTEKDGLPNDVINCIQYDDEGNLWMSTNRGLVQYARKNVEFITYDFHDGLQENEFNARAGFRAYDGELFFGGINGVTAFYPRRMKRNPFSPSPIIEKIYLRDKLFLKRNSIQSPIRLGYNQNFITFEFFVPEYTNPLKNQYIFRLYPFETQWRKTSRNLVEYTNIPPGHYQFQVRFINNDRKLSQDITQLTLIISTPPWKTWWAYLLYAIGFGLLGFGIIQYRIRQVKEEEKLKRAELRAQIAEAEKRAIEIENMKKSEEMERARELQLAMLPDAPPDYQYLDVETFMETASIVGGDYYDFLPISKDQLYVAIGDATGHGLAAGMTVALTKSGLKAIEGLPPVEILKRLNKVLKDILSDKFYMALHLLQITPTTVTVSSAAMPPLYYYNKKLQKLVEVLLPSLPLGTRLPENYQEITIHFNPGDTIVMLSDGLPERINSKGIPLGYNLVKECIEENIHLTPKQLMEKLIEIGENHADGYKIYDDITIVIIRHT
jgi:ligand-binding sensor domain-containing protein/serine phosphatase RsbU (regulator of sigma subunit)